jgi:hypothetical protein
MASMLAGRVSHLSKATTILDRSRIEEVEREMERKPGWVRGLIGRSAQCGTKLMGAIFDCVAVRLFRAPD